MTGAEYIFRALLEKEKGETGIPNHPEEKKTFHILSTYIQTPTDLSRKGNAHPPMLYTPLVCLQNSKRKIFQSDDASWCGHSFDVKK